MINSNIVRHELFTKFEFKMASGIEGARLLLLLDTFKRFKLIKPMSKFYIQGYDAQLKPLIYVIYEN